MNYFQNSKSVRDLWVVDWLTLTYSLVLSESAVAWFEESQLVKHRPSISVLSDFGCTFFNVVLRESEVYEFILF